MSNQTKPILRWSNRLLCWELVLFVAAALSWVGVVASVTAVGLVYVILSRYGAEDEARAVAVAVGLYGFLIVYGFVLRRRRYKGVFLIFLKYIRDVDRCASKGVNFCRYVGSLDMALWAVIVFLLAIFWLVFFQAKCDHLFVIFVYAVVFRGFVSVVGFRNYKKRRGCIRELVGNGR